MNPSLHATAARHESRAVPGPNLPSSDAPAHNGAATVTATAGWTVAGVAALVVAGMAINAAGVALKMPYACWQLTGARAAASTAVLATLVSMRRGNLAWFGVLYGLWLLATHASGLLVGSAILAGVGAWLIADRFAGRSFALRVLSTTLAFNVLLTLSALAKAISHDATSHTTIAGWAGGVGMRALATVAVVGVFTIVANARSAKENGAR